MQANQYVFTGLEQTEVRDIATIRNVVLPALQEYTQRAGFYQLLPVLMSPITDPLNHAVDPAQITHEGRTLQLTASMIFHKQLALASGVLDRIFILAPNIRLEKPSVKGSENHLLEFSQFDLEMRDASMFEVMAFLNDLLNYVFETVRTDEQSANALARLGRVLPPMNRSFPIMSSDKLIEEYGDDFEQVISIGSDTPVFITSYQRELYDREDGGTPGRYRNFDLIYPEGFGEGLSGAEREYDYDRIVAKMGETGVDQGPFARYLELAKAGEIPQTAGAGIGVERLLRFIVGRRQIRDVSPFDRSVGSPMAF